MEQTDTSAQGTNHDEVNETCEEKVEFQIQRIVNEREIACRNESESADVDISHSCNETDQCSFSDWSKSNENEVEIHDSGLSVSCSSTTSVLGSSPIISDSDTKPENNSDEVEKADSGISFGKESSEDELYHARKENEKSIHGKDSKMTNDSNKTDIFGKNTPDCSEKCNAKDTDKCTSKISIGNETKDLGITLEESSTDNSVAVENDPNFQSITKSTTKKVTDLTKDCSVPSNTEDSSRNHCEAQSEPVLLKVTKLSDLKEVCDKSNDSDTQGSENQVSVRDGEINDSDTSGPSSYNVSVENATGANNVKSNEEERSEDKSSSDNSDIEQEMDALDLFLSRRNRTSNDSSHSSGDEDSSRHRADDDETKSENSDNSESNLDMDLSAPPDSWFAIKELRKREIGYANKTYSSLQFTSKLSGSVGLAQRLKRNCRLERHEGCVNALHFNKSGTLLASGSDDLDIVVWNWLHMKPYFTFESGHRSNVFQCKFMPYTGDSHIVSCARDGQIRLAELSSTGICKGTKKVAQHRGAAHKLSLLEDSSHIFYSCGEDAVVYSIDLREEKPTKLNTTKENDKKIPLYSIHSNPMKSYEYCVGGRDHYIRIYDKRMLGGDGTSDNVLKKYCPHHLVNSEIKANVTCAVYNWNGEEVLGTYNDEDIYLFDNSHSDGAEHIHKYTGHRNNATVKGVNFYGPKSEFVVSGSDCGNVYLWEKNSEKVVNYFYADDGGVVNVLEPHPLMPVLATSGLDHDVKIWMPMGMESSNLKDLPKKMSKNKRERERERSNEPDMLDSRMLWFLMNHLRRTRRRPQGDGDSSTNSDDEERGLSDATDDDDEPMQCNPS